MMDGTTELPAPALVQTPPPIVVNAVPVPSGSAGPPLSVLVTTAPMRTRLDWYWIALCNAFGASTAKDIRDGKLWNVGWLGTFDDNKSIIHAVYDYYGTLYDRNPAKCHWAGLARIAGGPFFKGFALISTMEKAAAAVTSTMPIFGPLAGPGAVECHAALKTLMEMGKRIFTDMAWQHEAYTVGGIAEIRRLKAAGEFDRPYKDEPVPHDTPDAWETIDRDDPGSWSGNTDLFRREQLTIIPPGYSVLHLLPGVGPIMTANADSPHPWGHSFNDFFHQSSLLESHWVTIDADRWLWMSQDILPTYQARSESERGTLVHKSLEDLMDRKF
jgi:hypothetical protein